MCTANIKNVSTIIAVPAINGDAKYTSRLSARSALYTDLTLLLDGLSEALESIEYRNLIVRDNKLSRNSISSREKIWSELKKRYILDAGNHLFDIFWKEWKQCRSEAEKAQVVYFFFSLNDRLVADINTDFLYPLLIKAPTEIHVNDVLTFLDQSRTKHPEVSMWVESTRFKISKHYLASIRDFGLAKGKYKKTTIRPALYGAPVRLLIRALKLKGVSTRDIISSSIFRMLAIDQSEVVDSLSQLNQKGDICFKIQGDVVELDLEGRL